MKLKYYLRGLGIGIAVTAVIMGVSGGNGHKEMTDAQIIAKAKELGMTDASLTLQETAEVSENEETSETETVKEEQQQTETKEDAAETREQTVSSEVKAEKEVVNKIVVAIYPGEGSYTVSRKLAALGLVESADIFDEFLCQNGYDKRIVTGNHEVQKGMTAEEIARALTVTKE